MPWTSSSGSGRPPARRTCAASSGATSGSSAGAAASLARPCTTGPISRLAFSADGALLASGAEDGTIVLSSLDRPGPRNVLHGHRGPVTALTFSRDGKLLASASSGEDHSVALWDPATGRERWRRSGPSPSVRDVAFAADGKIMVTLGERAATLWDAITGEIKASNSAARGL